MNKRTFTDDSNTFGVFDDALWGKSNFWLFNSGIFCFDQKSIVNCEKPKEIIFKDWMFELANLKKGCPRYNQLWNFGQQISLNVVNSSGNQFIIEERPYFQNDPKLNTFSVLLLDSIAFIPTTKLIELRDMFIKQIFPRVVVANIGALGLHGELLIKDLDSHLITSGEIVALLRGLVSTRSHKYRKEMDLFLGRLSKSSLRIDHVIVCIATILIEVFWFNKVSVKPSFSKGLIGLYSNADYSNCKPDKEGLKQRICVGLNLRTKCMNTYNASHLHVSVERIKLERGNGLRPIEKEFCKYQHSRLNRGIFGVVYASNSCDITDPNCVCNDLHKVSVNMFERSDNRSGGVGIVNSNYDCEVCFLSSNGTIRAGDELLWDYDHTIKNKLTNLKVVKKSKYCSE
jgi:hypothetical protein